MITISRHIILQGLSLLLFISISSCYSIAVEPSMQYTGHDLDSLYLAKSYYTISQEMVSTNTERQEAIKQSAYYHLHHSNFNFFKFQTAIKNIQRYDNVISHCFNDLLIVYYNIEQYDEALLLWEDVNNRIECNSAILLDIYLTLYKIVQKTNNTQREISILKNISQLYMQKQDDPVFLSNMFWAKIYAQSAYNVMKKEGLQLGAKQYVDLCISQGIPIDTTSNPNQNIDYIRSLSPFMIKLSTKLDSLKYIVESNAITYNEREILLCELIKCDTSSIFDDDLADIYFRNHKYNKAIDVYVRGLDIINNNDRTPRFSIGIQQNLNFILLQNIAVCYLWQNNSIEAEKYIKLAEKYIYETFGISRNNLTRYYNSTNKYFDTYNSSYLQIYLKRQVMLSTRLAQLKQDYNAACDLILLYDSLSQYDINLSSFDVTLIDYNSFQNETAANVYSDINEEDKFCERINNLLNSYKYLYNDILAQNSETYIWGTVKTNRSYSVKDREKSLRAYSTLRNFMYDKLSLYDSKNYLTLVYDYTLFTKGALLNTEKAIYKITSQSKDMIHNLLQMKAHLATTTDIWGKDSIQRKIDIEERDLMKQIDIEYVLGQHDVTYSDMSQALQASEYAIEFISYNSMEGYMLTDNVYYYALLSDSHNIISIPLFEEKEISSLINTSSENQISFTYSYDGNGEQLTDLIWSKILPHIQQGKTIYFAPSGLLHQLAIEYLPYDENRTMPNVYNMVRLTSTREIVLNKQNTEYTTATIYGGIAYDLEEDVLLAESENYATENLLASRNIENDTLNRGSVKYLPGTKKEAESINTLLQQNNISAKLYTTAKANEESFKALSGKHNNILHIGTHGFTWTDSVAKKQDFFAQRVQLMGQEQHYDTSIDPLNRCGLLFAGANIALQGNSKNLPEGVQDGILTAKEISLMDLRDANLVVLSACETAKGDITSEGVFGLQRAFKMAGVQTIIMSLWKVSDQATQLLMTEFYNNWISKHLSKREAFRNAQNTVRTQYEEPVYWAGFIMLD